MSPYAQHIKMLHTEAQHRVSLVSNDSIGDAVMYRDIGRLLPMALNVAMEISLGSLDPDDVAPIRDLDYIYRSYLLVHNGALTDKREYVEVLHDLYRYVEKENAGKVFSLFNAALAQALCCLLYTSSSVMSGMVEQNPEAFFGHALAMNIIARAPVEVRQAAAQHAKSEGIYPSAMQTAVLNKPLGGVLELIRADQAQIVERLQAAMKKEVSDGVNQ